MYIDDFIAVVDTEQVDFITEDKNGKIGLWYREQPEYDTIHKKWLGAYGEKLPILLCVEWDIDDPCQKIKDLL